MESKLDRKSETKVLELEALFDISNLLSSSLDLDEILNNILFTIMGRMMVSKGAIFIIDESGQYLAANQKGLKIDKDARFSINVDSNQVYQEDQFPDDDFHKMLKQEKLKLLIPMTGDSGCIGVFVLAEKMSKKDYSKNEMTFLSALGNIAGQAIEKALNFDKLQLANRSLDQKVQQMSTLMEIGKNLNESLDFDTILKSISRTLMGQMLLSKHAIIYKIHDHFEAVLVKGIEVGEDIIALIEKEQEPITDADESFNTAYKDAQIAVIIPIVKNFEIKGYLLCGKKATLQAFTADEIEFLRGLSNNSASSLDNALLFKETLEKQKLEEELQLAKKIQRELLPKTTPSGEKFQLIGSNDSSKQVGGDYYDFLEFEGDKVGIAIGDVSGKGAAAALLMSNVQASMHALTANREWPIKQVIEKANSIIFKNTTPEKYITFFYGELDRNTNEFSYVNAGHNYPLIYRNGEYIELKTGGIILGMMDDMPYESDTVQLEKNDVLVMYTDGITEAMNEAEEEYDEPRLKEVIEKTCKKTSEEIHQSIIDSVFEFSPNANQFDDITLIVLKIVS